MDNKEKYIIDQLYNHRETVDTDELWSNLAGSIPRKDKKRRAIIWFCSGLFFVSLLSLIGFMLIDKPEGIKNADELLNNELTIAELLPPIASLTQDAGLKNIENDDLEKRTEHDSKEHVNNSLSTKKESEVTTVAKEKEGLFRKNPVQIMGAKEYPQSAVNHENKLLALSKNDVYSLFNEKNVATKTKGRLFETKQNVDKQVINARNEKVSFLAPLDFDNLVYRADLEIKRTVPVSVDLLTEQSIKVNKWSMFVNTGTSLITRNLSTSDPEYKDKLNRRNQIENVRGGFEVSVGLCYRLTPSLSISSGLIFGQIFEQSTYSTSYLIASEGQQITSIIHTQDGSVNTVSENVSSLTLRETDEIRNNALKYYSIPLNLKYRLIENETYQLHLNGTVTYSISQQYVGFTSLDSNQPAYNIELDGENNFDRSGAGSFGLGLDVIRKISHNWDLNFGLGARRMRGISSDLNPIDQKYNLYTFTFGVSRKI